MFNTQKVTQKYRNSTLIYIKKKNCARIGSDRNRPILRIFWIGSDLKKWYRCIPSFYQFIGFWWHPFTAKHSLVSKWCNAKFLQIDEETILDGMRVSTLSANFHFWVNYFFKPVYAFVIFIYTKNIMLSWIIDFPWPPFCRHMFSLSTVLLQQNDKSLWVYWKCSLLNYSTLLKLLLHVLCFRQYRWPL